MKNTTRFTNDKYNKLADAIAEQIWAFEGETDLVVGAEIIDPDKDEFAHWNGQEFIKSNKTLNC
jgi:hypothetical protein